MIPELNALYQIVDRMGQDVWRHEQMLQPARTSPILTHSTAERQYGPAAMTVHLSAKGSAPLALDGLKGAAAHPQKANFPNLPTLPQLGDKTYSVGDAVLVKGTGYTRTATGWQALNSGGSNVQTTQVSQAGGIGGSSGSTYQGPTTQVNETVARTLALNYHNTGTTAMFVSVSVTVPTGVALTAMSDSSSTPSTVVGYIQNGTLVVLNFQVFFVVLAGNYYTVTCPTGTLVNWTEWT